jgi:hypothetical protein
MQARALWPPGSTPGLTTFPASVWPDPLSTDFYHWTSGVSVYWEIDSCSASRRFSTCYKSRIFINAFTKAHRISLYHYGHCTLTLRCTLCYSPVCILCLFRATCCGQDSSVYSDLIRAGRSANRIPFRLDFPFRPDRPWNSPGLLYNGYRVFSGRKAAGAWCWPPIIAGLLMDISCIFTCPLCLYRRVVGWPCYISGQSYPQFKHRNKMPSQKLSSYICGGRTGSGTGFSAGRAVFPPFP